MNNIFLFNYTMIRIYARKIEKQLNVRTFVWDCDNLIEIKKKQIMKINSKLVKYWMIKL
jgi:TnpA family transposase